MATHFCPSCGYNLERDKPIVRDGWSLTHNSAVYRGSDIGITAGEAGVLYALASAAPRFVTALAIGNRVSAGDDVANVVCVLIRRLRRKLGDACPIMTRRGSGYSWRAAA